jgi:hypothetical protein
MSIFIQAAALRENYNLDSFFQVGNIPVPCTRLGATTKTLIARVFNTKPRPTWPVGIKLRGLVWYDANVTRILIQKLFDQDLKPVDAKLLQDDCVFVHVPKFDINTACDCIQSDTEEE